MSEKSDLIGAETPPQTVVIERGPVSNFARAVTDDNPIFQRPQAARQAGFDAIPAPPTYSFAMHHWGLFPELQPDQVGDTNPIMHAIGVLMQEGGLVLHGEQEFVYHRHVEVGDKLTSRGRIADLYTKPSSGGGEMTFLVTETDWLDEAGAKVVTSVMTLLHRP